MKLINSLLDKEYPFKGVNHTRNIVRAFVLNKNNEVAILTIERDDEFGKSKYYETPGGGQEENETMEDAIKREIDEELGCKIEIITYLGRVEDYYNLIKRKNINNYFIARKLSDTKIHHASKGDDLIKEINYVSIDKAIKLYESMDKHGVPALVKQRELPVIKMVKEYLKRKENL